MEWRFWAQTRPAQLNRLGDASGDDCESIEPLLSLYGDGMASAAEARLVEAHLPGCESCRESLAWMQATRRALSARPVMVPPPDLHARIAEAIAASEAAPLRLRPVRTFATRPAFAAAASLAAVGLFLGYSLTHLPRPGDSVKPVPPTVASVPSVTPPAVVSPVKPTAPPVTIKKPQPTPLIADNNVPDETVPAPFPASSPRVPAKNAERPVKNAPSVVVAPRLEPVAPPRLKPVAPRPTNLMAVKPTVIIKHTPAPLPTKTQVLTARNELREPDVKVLPAKVTPQELPATEKIASATPSEPHTQNVDYISEVRAQIKVRAHLPSPQAQISRTVGMSLRGAARVTQTFGQDGKAAPIGGIHGDNF